MNKMKDIKVRKGQLVNRLNENNNKRQEQALVTREKIYNSALKLIKEKGFENVLVEDITTSAGVAKGTFYNHFNSKENLLLYTFKKSDIFYLEAYSKVKDINNFNDMIREFIFLSYQEIEKFGKEILRALCINLFSDESKSIFLDKNRELYKCLIKIIEFGKKTSALNNNISIDYYVEKIVSFLLGIEIYWSMYNKDSCLASFSKESISTLVKGLSHI
ncbi:TetR/AcrR family transcriptional regulator [Brevibacillus sp. NRS-1366]|uniref:TetR/AcrR family transcriptional regulator n=1 Tax=Brevibacillus sp. NRS-1366 TaxID=3233899 RepID=UPI003D22E672